MRALFLFTWLLIWGLRLADPLAHSVLHHHGDHCAEQGQHLHEGDDACEWSDPALIVGLQPAPIGWEPAARSVLRQHRAPRESRALAAVPAAKAPRAPPLMG